MRKQRYLYIFCIVIVFSLIVRNILTTSSELKTCKADLDNTVDNNLELTRFIMLHNHFECMNIKVDNEILDSLSKLLESGPKLVFSFNEYSCEACIEYLLDWSNEVAKHIDKNNILFLVMYEDDRESYFINLRLGERFKFFGYQSEDDLYIDEEYVLQPPNLFVLDSSLVVRNFYIFSLKYPALNEEYIKDIEQKFSLGYLPLVSGKK